MLSAYCPLKKKKKSGSPVLHEKEGEPGILYHVKNVTSMLTRHEREMVNN